MKYFFTGRLPDVGSILLVESGSRAVLEKVVPGLRQTWGPGVRIDLVSCYATLPVGLDSDTTQVFRVADYRGGEGRSRLYRELRDRKYSLMGIICSEEPLMFKWKWALTARVPAKVFIINENGDYFWLDRMHFKLIRKFVLLRAGLAGSGAVRTLTRVVSFPFTLLFLLLYATVVHARRALRKATT